jgi:hypothetical protein
MAATPDERPHSRVPEPTVSFNQILIPETDPMPIFAVTLLPNDLLTLGLLLVLSVFVGAWLFRRDTEREARRRDMIELSQLFSELGLERLSGLATCYAVGDYSELYRTGRQLAKDLRDKDTAMQLLRKAFFAQLSIRLERDEDHQQILDAVLPYLADAEEDEE